MTAQPYLDPDTTSSVYTSVRRELDLLLPTFGLEGQRETIRDVYGLLCRRSLRFPAGSRPLHGSRLNEDGTPFQLAVAVTGSTARLQLVSDVGPLAAGNAERAMAARRCLPRIADVLACSGWVSHLLDVLDEFVPTDDPNLLGDDSGPVWLGVSVAPNRLASLKVYINARWGTPDARWARLTEFAGVAGVTRDWREARAHAAELEPLGVSVTVTAGAPPKYRIYLGGYGRRFGYYEDLAHVSAGSTLAGLVRRYGQTVLADRHGHPTRSVVWSFGAEDGSFVDHKVELCGHCAFEDDVEARVRSLAWLRATGALAAPYTHAVDVLSGTSARLPRTRLHAYLGVGANRHGPYSTFYFNPAATLA